MHFIWFLGLDSREILMVMQFVYKIILHMTEFLWNFMLNVYMLSLPLYERDYLFLTSFPV